jgi:hypothetical protein
LLSREQGVFTQREGESPPRSVLLAHSTLANI